MSHARKSLSITLLVSMLGGSGCQGSEGADFEFGAEGSGAGDPADDGHEPEGSRSPLDGDDEDDGSDADDPGEDEGPDDDGPGLPTELCSGIDLVFVVNNTYTMFDEQLRLQSAATEFVAEIAGAIPEVTQNMHVGVLTTDDHRFVASTSACEAPYASGASYMVFAETMGDELGCSLEVGIDGDPNDRPVQMLLGALSDEMLVPEGLHDGFLREKALLVVVIATDEDDRLDPVTGWGSVGDPVDWATALAGLKGGHAQDVVVLSLVGTPGPNACPDFQWNGHEGAEVATRLIELTEAFPHGAVGDLCSPEYASFLLGEVPSIADACTEFVAP
jgi:hypothetical protein